MQKRSIAELNDAFRRGQPDVPGRIMMTPSVSSLPPEEVQEIMEKVQTFDDFTQDNDPYGEHDLGTFEYQDQTILWKMDYYNTSLDKGSEDPTDLNKTIRIITIMFSHEY